MIALGVAFKEMQEKEEGQKALGDHDVHWGAHEILLRAITVTGVGVGIRRIRQHRLMRLSFCKPPKDACSRVECTLEQAQDPTLIIVAIHSDVVIILKVILKRAVVRCSAYL